MLNIMDEIWKKIDGYNGDYEISSLGRVKSYKRNKSKIMSNTIDSRGYYQIGLRVNMKPKSLLVHRLVAKAFIQNANGYEFINHKDENKLNNHVDNLEWCTRSYNTLYGTGLKRRKEKISKPIIGTCINSGKTITFDSILDASILLGKKNGGNINKAINSKYKTLYGYTWKYAS